jgi:hypothetical protein
VADTPRVERRTDGTVSIDFGEPGPFITLTPRKIRGLINALALAGWINQDGRPMRPAE